MLRFPVLLSFLATLGFALALSGCGGPAQSPDASPPQQGSAGEAAGGHQPGDHTGHGEHAGHTGHGEHEKELSQLSAADRALAEKQQVCPVSGQPLGSMGKPYKVTVKGQEVFLCCQGCEGEIKENPEKYLAKLPK